MSSKIKTITSKIFSSPEDPSFQKKLNYWRFMEEKLVFTNGCFDILHLGHVDYLSRAADLGDVLIVGLNTDDSVSLIKGSERPFNNQQARASLLASLFFVDAVVLFHQETPYELIKTVQPDVLVKGSDYKEEEIAGRDIVKARKGQVVTIDLLPEYSTSGLLEKLKKK